MLSDSGELTEPELKKLEQHLARCDQCREYRDALHQVVSAARASLLEGEPGAAVVERISAAARERIAARRIVFERPARQVVAYAAALALLVVGWLMLSSDDRSGRINEINVILEMTSEDDASEREHGTGQADSDYPLPSRERAAGEHGLRMLADELLLMEGLADDDLTDVEVLREEPRPTALRLRSTVGLQPKKCV